MEILQTEESTHSTMQQIQDYQKRHTASIHYQAYDSRSKKSKAPSNEQNSSSSSSDSKRQCFWCGEPFSRKHMKECRAKDVKCNGCGIKGHLKKCCKKSGNFLKDSNWQNQSSTGSTKMNYVHTAPLPQTEADFFNEKGLLKVQGLSVPFACVGSGDPVRVLRLYTTNTLDIFWSIYYWGICTTCRYWFYCAVLKPYALRLPTTTATTGQLTSRCVCVWLWVHRTVSRTVLCRALYTACVDASRTVFWDRSVLR